MSEMTSPTPQQVAALMERVYALVKACPPGRVTTYSWVGKVLGYPRGARMIGWIMNETPHDVPAQRVISSKGELTGAWAFGHPGRMRELLEAEGVSLSDDERVDLKRYGWNPESELGAEALQRVLSTASSLHVTPSARLLHLMSTDPASPLRSSN
ncbi:MAG TPA: MGMT family protein [Ktedonobacteraceae bacterium]|nr:MGMT family protein [Ktedonobacteraceae bacterium]